MSAASIIELRLTLAGLAESGGGKIAKQDRCRISCSSNWSKTVVATRLKGHLQCLLSYMALLACGARHLERPHSQLAGARYSRGLACR